MKGFLFAILLFPVVSLNHDLLSWVNDGGPENSISDHLAESVVGTIEGFYPAFISYMRANRATEWQEICDPSCHYERVVTNDGVFDPNQWHSDLVPDHMFDPDLPEGWTLSFSEDSDSFQGCIEIPSMTDLDQSVLSSSITRLSPKTILGTTCDPSTGETIPLSDIDTYSGSTTYVTHYLVEG